MIDFQIGSFYSIRHPRNKPSWELIARYKGFYGVNGHTFDMLAENDPLAPLNGKGAASYLVESEVFCLHSSWFSESDYLADSIQLEDLSLFVSADRVYPLFPEVLKSQGVVGNYRRIVYRPEKGD